MYKYYKYRIYPTGTQKVLLEKHFGCVRFVYNLALETKIAAYRGSKHSLSAYDLQKQLTDLKKDLPWLNEVTRDSMDKAILNMDVAYSKFFKGSGFPALKKKSGKNSFFVKESIIIKNGFLFIGKFREGIKVIQHRAFNGVVKSATISKTPTNKYYASILVQTENIPFPHNSGTVGIDLGIKTFAVLSDGKEYESPNLLRKSLDRLAVLQRRASRKKKGSANRKKANLRVSILHERITNQRNHFLHNVSNEITNQYGTICIEDLAVKNMVKNRKLALSISDSSWGRFVTMLKYKSDWKGREIITIDRFEPTSKKCSGCGSIKDMPLIERIYNCDCGLTIDRDINAAINIRNSGLLRASEPMELPTLVGAMK